MKIKGKDGEYDLISLDTETYLIDQMRCRAPQIVCWTMSDGVKHEIWHRDDPKGQAALVALLASTSIICGANIAYDMAVLLAAYEGLEELIFRKYKAGKVWDTSIAATLDAIGEGRFHEEEGSSITRIFKKDGDVLRDGAGKITKDGKVSEGKYASRFSLANTQEVYLGKTDAKINAKYRMSYGELDKVPMYVSDGTQHVVKIWDFEGSGDKKTLVVKGVETCETWPKMAIEYPLDDARNTAEIAYNQITRADFVNRKQVPFHTYAAFCLHLGSVYGIHIDQQKISELEKKYFSGIEPEIEFFVNQGVMIRKKTVRKTWASPKIPEYSNHVSKKFLAELVTLEMGADAKQTVKGNVSTSRDVLTKSTNALLSRYAEFARGDKMRTSYLPKLKRVGNGTFGDNVNPVLSTGRVSYQGITQLVPSEVRPAFVPSAGMAFCSVDFAALELCTFAQACKDVLGYSSMGDIINTTKDPGSLHTRLAANIANMEYSAFEALVKQKDPWAVGMRAVAKMPNFGFPGGMSEVTFVINAILKGVKLCVALGVNKDCHTFSKKFGKRETLEPVCVDCVDVARTLKTAWLNTFQEAGEYLKYVASLPGCRGGEAVITNARTGFTRAGLRYTQACNHSFQHLGAVGAKKGFIALTEASFLLPDSGFYGSVPVAFIHDEVISEVPLDRLHEAGYAMRDIMVREMQKVCEDVHISAEPAVMTHWNKKADTAFDENGKLTLWKDKK